MIISVSRLLLLLVLLFGSGMSWGECHLPSMTATFDNITSFTLNTTPQQISTTVNVNCGSGLAIGLLGDDTISLMLTGATWTRGNLPALRTASSEEDTIVVRLCTDVACRQEFTIGGNVYSYNRQALISLVTTGLNFALPLYLYTVPGENVAAGNYAVTLNMLVTYKICTINVAGICIVPHKGSQLVPIDVMLHVTYDCTTIIAPDIDFGSAPLVREFTAISQSINVVCTKGSSYTIGLSNGNHAVNNQRHMANGTQLLAYDIYKAGTINRWGATGNERVPSAAASGISSNGLIRSYHYTARISPQQDTPPAGNYNDNVVVDLSF